MARKRIGDPDKPPKSKGGYRASAIPRPGPRRFHIQSTGVDPAGARREEAERDRRVQEAIQAARDAAPSLAIAEHVLKDWGRKKEEEPSLADQFIAGTYTYAKQMAGPTARLAKLFEPSLAQYRDDMRRAHRFVLDNDLTRWITELAARLTPERALARLQIATLPYEVCWIEHDLKAKVGAMRDMASEVQLKRLDPHLSDVGDRLGLLLYRLSDTAMACQLVGSQAGLAVGANVSCYLVSREPVADFTKLPKGHTGTQSAHTY